MQPYKTLAADGYAYYEIQKSKFHAYTAHVESEAEARDFITSIKKKHFDARHNCSAWVLGEDSGIQKSNDDGEPGGTAGNPILEAIKQHGLTNAVVVVTRYFGGIKLGAGGLIRASNHTASIGLDASDILEIKPMARLSVALDYDLWGTMENWLRASEIRTDGTDYTDKVTVQLLIEPDQLEAVTTEITNLTAARAVLTPHEPEYLALPVTK